MAPTCIVILILPVELLHCNVTLYILHIIERMDGNMMLWLDVNQSSGLYFNSFSLEAYHRKANVWLPSYSAVFV